MNCFSHIFYALNALQWRCMIKKKLFQSYISPWSNPLFHPSVSQTVGQIPLVDHREASVKYEVNYDFLILRENEKHLF